VSFVQTSLENPPSPCTERTRDARHCRELSPPVAVTVTLAELFLVRAEGKLCSAAVRSRLAGAAATATCRRSPPHPRTGRPAATVGHMTRGPRSPVPRVTFPLAATDRQGTSSLSHHQSHRRSAAR
jgi:hypothetical protein